MQAGGRRFDPGWLHSANRLEMPSLWGYAENGCPDQGISRAKATGSVEIVGYPDWSAVTTPHCTPRVGASSQSAGVVSAARRRRVSHVAIAAALALADVSAGERLAAFALASFANRDHRAWPGTRIAAVRAGLSRSQYLAARDGLVKRALVVHETASRESPRPVVASDGTCRRSPRWLLPAARHRRLRPATRRRWS